MSILSMSVYSQFFTKSVDLLTQTTLVVDVFVMRHYFSHVSDQKIGPTSETLLLHFGKIETELRIRFFDFAYITTKHVVFFH